jgi:hypothetical protein
MIWTPKHPSAKPDQLGLIPGFLNENDPRPAKEQIDRRYVSGWQSFPGFTMLENGNLSYPGDLETRLLFESNLRDETIRFYEGSWLAIIQPDGFFEIARLD